MESTPPSMPKWRRWYRKKSTTPSHLNPPPLPRASSPPARAPPLVQPPSPEPQNPAWGELTATVQELKKSAKYLPALAPVIDRLIPFLVSFEAATRHHQDSQKLAEDLGVKLRAFKDDLNDSTSTHVTDKITNIIRAIQDEIGPVDTQNDYDMSNRALAAATTPETSKKPIFPSEVSGGPQVLRKAQNTSQGGIPAPDEFEDSALIQRYHRLEVNTGDVKRMAMLDALKPVKQAIYNSQFSTTVNRRPCTPGTRIAIRSDLDSWSSDSNGPNIFWMSGMAGTGKTTIAYSQAESLDSRGQLAGSFFCTRTSPECRDAKQIIPTIAYQLAYRSILFQSALCKALQKKQDIRALNIAAQFIMLLRDPLLETRNQLANNMVFVIDALDECAGIGTVARLQDILFRFAPDLPIKFLATSRPEPNIRMHMISQRHTSRSALVLHEIDRSLAQADIQLYLQMELASMPPTAGEVDQLARRAGNLFIYAATAVRYICPYDHTIDSGARLRTLLIAAGWRTRRYTEIDDLYTTILGTALNDSKLGPEGQNHMKLVLWTSVCAQECVTVRTLAALVGLDEAQTLMALQPLRSVVNALQLDSLVSTFHKSFPDFLFDHDRSIDFFCDAGIHNQFLARRCFEIMKEQLRFNAPAPESPSVLAQKDLQPRIEKNLSHELIYACRYWADHLQFAEVSDELRSKCVNAYRLRNNLTRF